MRRAAITLLAAAALALPATVSAKEITKVTACGTDGCVTTHDQTVLRGLMDGGPPTIPPSTRGKAVRLRATVAERPGGQAIARFQSWFIPSTGLLVTEDGTWMKLPAPAAHALVKLTHGLAFFPATKVSGAVEPPAKPAPAADDGSGAGWLLIAVPLGAVLAAGAALLARRRRPGGGRAPTGATP
jgi:hypothetical protein